jgi:hypothetical protein
MTHRPIRIPDAAFAGGRQVAIGNIDMPGVFMPMSATPMIMSMMGVVLVVLRLTVRLNARNVVDDVRQTHPATRATAGEDNHHPRHQ